MKRKLSLFTAGLACTLMTGCGSDGKVSVAFKNITGAARVSRNAVGPTETPTVFGMKLVVIYLVEDVDPNTQNNVGQVARIWVNPKCDADLTLCGIGPAAGAHQVTDYFDFALTTEQVNANLNSQGLSISAGTYKYIRVDFAGPTGANELTVNNLKFGNSTTTHEIRPNFGNGYTVAIDPPITIAAGETVRVTLSYDLEDSYYTDTVTNNSGTPPAGGVMDNWYCTSDDDPKKGPCLYFPGFTPSAEKI